MPSEIERKFLVLGKDWQQGQPSYIIQGYLNRSKDKTVRVRIVDNDVAYLTIKGITLNVTRSEFEFKINLAYAKQLLNLCEGGLIEKLRYRVPYQGFTWEVDEFIGRLDGLVIAEIELESEDQSFKKPAWLGEEVSHLPQYYNSNL